jgi:hypothetical protein
MKVRIEAETLGAAVPRGGDIGYQRDVRRKAEPGTVGRFGRLITQASEIAEEFFFMVDNLFESMEVGRRGIDEHAAAIAVYRGGDAFQAPDRQLADAHDRGDPD